MGNDDGNFPNLILLDGGMGRELDRIGAPFRQPEWSALALIEAPELVKRVHQFFAQAGSDILTSSNYAVVPFHIGEERFWSQGLELIRLSGELVRDVADSYNRKVAGAIPPIFGSYRPDLFDSAKALDFLEVIYEGLSPFADIWLAETLSSCIEAEIVAAVVKNDKRPLWLSYTLRDEIDLSTTGPLLRSGETVEKGVRTALDAGASAVLFNCSQPEVMLDAVKTAVKTVGQQSVIAVGVYANAFPALQKEVQANDGLMDIRHDMGPLGYLEFVKDWYEHGASIIGGCCGIGPEHIKAIEEARNAKNDWS